MLEDRPYRRTVDNAHRPKFAELNCVAELRLTTTLQVVMTPKKDIVYQRGNSKSVSLSCRLIVNSDNEQDPACVPATSTTPPPVTRVTRGTLGRWFIA